MIFLIPLGGICDRFLKGRMTPYKEKKKVPLRGCHILFTRDCNAPNLEESDDIWYLIMFDIHYQYWRYLMNLMYNIWDIPIKNHIWSYFIRYPYQSESESYLIIFQKMPCRFFCKVYPFPSTKKIYRAPCRHCEGLRTSQLQQQVRFLASLLPKTIPF